MNKFTIAILSALLPLGVLAQDTIPGFDIFLIWPDEPQRTPLNVTARAGYDNQPSFSADGSSLYYTRQAEDNQTDIWVYQVQNGPWLPFGRKSFDPGLPSDQTPH